jgi:hypothetical protein
VVDALWTEGTIGAPELSLMLADVTDEKVGVVKVIVAVPPKTSGLELDAYVKLPEGNDGRGTAVTVVDAVTLVPNELLTVRTYVVVASEGGVTLKLDGPLALMLVTWEPPEVASVSLQLPAAAAQAPFEMFHSRLVALVLVTVPCDGPKLTITGAATTVIVTL